MWIARVQATYMWALIRGFMDFDRARAIAELDLGVSYCFAFNWAAGIECRRHNKLVGCTLRQIAAGGTRLSSSVSPCTTRCRNGLLPPPKQMRATAYADEQKAATVGRRIYGDEHTFYGGIRLRVDYLLS